MVKQLEIDAPCPLLDEIVGMRNETDQAVSRPNQIDLLLPQADRVIPQDVKERIVLNRCQRQLKNVADEVRHHCATAAPLRFEVCDIGH